MPQRRCVLSKNVVVPHNREAQKQQRAFRSRTPWGFDTLSAKATEIVKILQP